MPSFDIVSEVENNEIANAVENSRRELGTRFDFRNVEASFDLKDDVVTIKSESDMQCHQLLDILRNNMTKRGIDPYALDVKDDLIRSGKTFAITVGFKQGVEQPMAKKIIKLLKDSKMKVQASIQGDQVRVTGKKRDDLQAAMQLIREGDLGQPFQFKNFRD
ncbi:YajQ family cyclic di-GMP-binding protein [Porticoccaceae bacterium LTM1]|nr:YajQ family cyclic di-GMP-binding protein [Porticoccaceae bacterium LTM1]